MAMGEAGRSQRLAAIYVASPARTAQDTHDIDPSKQWAPDGWTLK